jgi:hypothetical protein
MTGAFANGAIVPQMGKYGPISGKMEEVREIPVLDVGVAGGDGGLG